MKRSFIVAHFWDDSNVISCYTFGSSIHYGDETYAKNFLNYVREQSPEHDWMICWIPTERDNMEESPKKRKCENCGKNVNIEDGGSHDGCDFVWGRRGWRQLGAYDFKN